MLQVTLTQAVKVRKTEDVVLHRYIQGGRAGYSWDPFLGVVVVDITGFIYRGTLSKGNEMRAPYVDVGAIVHTYTCRTIINNYDAFIYASDCV
ncbi:hypothetical protein KR059_011102 [Drosophila kikkawai]|nr:hypothetical protein KR059_011102 [Drosophila kikkawai]